MSDEQEQRAMLFQFFPDQSSRNHTLQLILTRKSAFALVERVFEMPLLGNDAPDVFLVELVGRMFCDDE